MEYKSCDAEVYNMELLPVLNVKVHVRSQSLKNKDVLLCVCFLLCVCVCVGGVILVQYKLWACILM